MKDFERFMAIGWSFLLLISSISSAENATDPTLYSSRIDGLLDPFWRQS